MSSKITSKNLHYDSTLPPFLARLRASHASRDGRHEMPAARPKRARDADDDAEDEPVYVDEETGETVTRSEFEEREREMERGEGGGEREAEGEEGRVKEDEGIKEGRDKAGVVGIKRRKARRIVGEEEEEEKEGGAGDEEKKQKGKPEVRKLEKGKVAKKGKKIKLSFGDDE